MPINNGDKITNEPFNNSTDGFFTKLEAIRQEHYNKTHNSALSSSFTTDPNTEEGELVTDSPFLLMRTYLQTLRNSAYISGTSGYTRSEKRRTALRTGLAVFVTGLLLFFFGENIFNLFGFTLDAFRIGAGCLLFLSATSLMNDKPQSPQHIDANADISVVPLTIPLCMGPASIGAVMIMGASCTSFEERLVGAAALFVAASCITLMLLMATKLERVLRKTGLAVLAKLTGLILAAIAAQVIFTGLKAFLR